MKLSSKLDDKLGVCIGRVVLNISKSCQVRDSLIVYDCFFYFKTSVTLSPCTHGIP